MDNLLETLKPDLKAVIYGALGFVVNLIWLIFRNRRIAVTWTATFQPIRPVGHEPISSKVSVLVNALPALNLQLCQITVTNDSSRDIENMDLVFQFYTPFIVVEGRGSITTSAKNLLFSESFQKTARAVAEMPEATRTSSPSYDYLGRCREYNLPALNRGELATFMFWINSPQPTDLPQVLTSTDKAGVKLVSRPADIRPLNMAHLKSALRWGVPVSLLFAYLISITGLTPLPLAFLAVIGGMLCGTFGFMILAILRWMRRVL